MYFVTFAINILFSGCYILLLLRAILPWMPSFRRHPLVVFVYRLTDPVLNPIRLGLPPQRIGIDVSPFLIMVLLWLIHRALLFFLGGL